MLTEPIVSVIMPAYNAEKYISKAIESVIHQTFDNWELIIVDDGSTDETASIIKKYIEKNLQIKYLYQDNGKQGKARNLAIIESKGHYVAFLDADDAWTTDKLEIQINILKRRPEFDLICSQGYILSEDQTISNFYVKVKEWGEGDIETFIEANQIAILSVVVKKSAVEKVGFFSENEAVQNVEDYHLWIKLLSKGSRFLTTGDFLFYYRIHSSQSTYRNTDKLKLLSCYLDLVENKVIDFKSKALRNHLKWMVFISPNLKDLLKKMQIVFPERKLLLFFFRQMEKMVGSKSFLKKLIFHSL